MKNPATLIIGANSEIAKALAKQVIPHADTQLILVSRSLAFYRQDVFKHATLIEVDDYQEQDIKAAIDGINLDTELEITRVFICQGILHNAGLQPEKRLEDFSASAFMQVITANTLTPMLWLQGLTPILKSKTPCKVVVFNARVGSISENKLGGWYSYRASKAAMNMLIKSAAVELARRAKNVKLISFHPGTTDSPLSKPFQKNVPEGKLFSSEFVATQLLTIVEKTEVDGEASYLDWEGKTINW